MTATRREIASTRQRAQVLGILLGARQGEEHFLGGLSPLNDQALSTLARLAWRFEALPQLGESGEYDAFMQAYRAAYRFEPVTAA